MKDIMIEAGFPCDAVEELMAVREKLGALGSLEQVLKLAEDTMEGYPRENRLVSNLKKANGLSGETGIDGYTLELFMLLHCWEILKERYKEKGISMKIFRDTLQDMKCKLLECREVYGINGIFVGEWYDGFFDMTRFALGRLQFEMRKFPYEESFSQGGRTVKKGDPVINMHIPSSGPLGKKEAEDAFSQAAEFFKEEFGDEKPVFVMNSWLLDTDLIKLLPEGNTKEFVERFTVLEVKKNPVFEDGWRVFGSSWKYEPAKLPRRTRLQKNIGDYLQQGGQLGGGYGIFVWE